MMTVAACGEQIPSPKRGRIPVRRHQAPGADACRTQQRRLAPAKGNTSTRDGRGTLTNWKTTSQSALALLRKLEEMLAPASRRAYTKKARLPSSASATVSIAALDAAQGQWAAPTCCRIDTNKEDIADQGSAPAGPDGRPRSVDTNCGRWPSPIGAGRRRAARAIRLLRSDSAKRAIDGISVQAGTHRQSTPGRAAQNDAREQAAAQAEVSGCDVLSGRRCRRSRAHAVTTCRGIEKRKSSTTSASSTIGKCRGSAPTMPAHTIGVMRSVPGRTEGWILQSKSEAE